MTTSPRHRLTPLARLTTARTAVAITAAVMAGGALLRSPVVLGAPISSPAHSSSASPTVTPATVFVGASPTRERIVTVSGKAAIRVPADQATIIFGVVNRKLNVADAQEENEKRTKEVLAALKRVGMSENDISPGTFDLTEDIISTSQTEKDSGENIYKTTYGVDTRITVRITNLGTVGSVLRTAVKAGANRVSVEFGTSKLRTARDAARAAAIKAAREKGRDMAAAAGVEIGQVMSFSEVNSWWGLERYRSSNGSLNSVQNISPSQIAATPTGQLGEQFGSGPILIEAEVTMELSLK